MKIKKGSWQEKEIKKIKELYLLGYTAKEIGISIDRTKGAVQKKIQEIKKDENLEVNELVLKQAEFLRNQKARKERIIEKECLRAVNYEGNKYMGDATLVQKNPSAYRVNEKGDKVLDVKNEYVYSYDMPKRLNNNAKREYGKTFISGREEDE